jgi:DnaK suppressor protein
MNKTERKKFEKKLLELREAKLAYIAMLRELSISKTQREDSGDISAFTSHPADISTESDEREKMATLLSRETQLLKELDSAVERVRSGAYGKCDQCGEDISPARLEALPFATLCVKCQSESEKA